MKRKKKLLQQQQQPPSMVNKKIVGNLHDNYIKTELNEIEEDINDGDAASVKIREREKY